MKNKTNKQLNKDKSLIKKNIFNKDFFLKVIAWTLLIITIISILILAIYSGIATFNEIVNGDMPGGIPSLELSLSLFIATFISLGIVFGLVTFFLWKPMNEHLEIRRKNIETNINVASFKNKEAAINLSKSVLTEKEARLQAKDIVNASKQEGNDHKREIINEAKKQTEKMLNQSREQITKEKEQMYDDIKIQILETSLLAAEKIIEKNMDSDINKQMIKDLISELK